MKFPNRKTRSRRLLESVSELLEVPAALKPNRRSRIKSAVPNPIKARGASNAVKVRLPQAGARTTGLVAGGVAGLTAGSAGISALRRRKDGAGDRP